MNPQKVLKFWRNAIADSDWLARSSYKNDKINKCLRSSTNIRRGLLSDGEMSVFMKRYKRLNGFKQSKEVKNIPLLLAPMVYQLEQEHHATRKKIKEFVTPFWIIVRVDEKGRVYRPDTPIHTSFWVDRSLLSPTDHLVKLNTVEAYEALLAKSAIEDGDVSFSKFLDFINELLNDLCDIKAIMKANRYQHVKGKWFVDVLRKDPTKSGSPNKNLITLLDQIESIDNHPLLKNYASPVNIKDRPLLTDDEQFSLQVKHCAHVHRNYGLEPTQREALLHTLVTNEGKILPVNGPPGNGKTTLIVEMVLSNWVNAAIENRKVPPICILSSTNNEAIFSALEACRDDVQVDRWLPKEVNQSFGCFFTNNSELIDQATEKNLAHQRVKDREGDFHSKARSRMFLNNAVQNYIKEANKCFGGNHLTIDQVIEKTQQRIVACHTRYIDIYKILNQYREQCKTFYMSGEIKKQEMFELDKQDLEEQLKYARSILAAWEAFLSEESFILKLISTCLASVYRLRQKNWNQFIGRLQQENSGYCIVINEIDWVDAQSVTSRLQSEMTLIKDEMRETSKQLTAQKKLIQQAESLKGKFKKFVEESGLTFAVCSKPENWDEPKNINQYLDISSRYELLKWSSRYWAGRYINAVQKFFKDNPDGKPRQNKEARRCYWAEISMVTPMIASTAQSAPGFFDYYETGSKSHFGLADWLILDEAGQVSPSIASGMVALAKRGIFVGDTWQLKPVTQLDKSFEIATAIGHDIIKDHAEYEHVSQFGVFCNNSDAKSAMHVAQTTCEYRKVLDDGRLLDKGVYLLEHWRCVPEIVEFCNDLCYNGMMIPRRKSNKGRKLPAMGFLHVKGYDEKSVDGSSRTNPIEANAIAQWVLENQDVILGDVVNGDSNKTLKDVVAILTPFKQQASILMQALKDRGVEIDLVGTTNITQGKQRPVVIFSPVYSSNPNARYYMLDSGPNLLNVAVSRAKDHLFVLGDMDIFDPSKQSVCGYTARYFRTLVSPELNPLQDLSSVFPSAKQPAYGVENGIISEVERHRSFLSQSIQRADCSLIIVSPFISDRAVVADQLPSLLEQAIKRRIDVKVFVDNGFVENQGNSAGRAIELLLKAGVEILKCSNIHSKMVIVDDKIIANGSFNWLSAERQNKNHMRHDATVVMCGDQAKKMIERLKKDIQSRVLSTDSRRRQTSKMRHNGVVSNIGSFTKSG